MSKKSKTGKDAADGAKGAGKKKKILAGGGLLLVAAAAWFFLLRSPSAAAPVDAEPEPGAVVALDPITVNLANGHFLRVGLGLQVAMGKTLSTAEAPEEGAVVEADPKADGARALDAAIDVFSGKTTAQLTGAGRSAMQKQLVKELVERYDGAVMDVYFTEFVMQ